MDNIEILIHSYLRWIVCFGMLTNLALVYYGYFFDKKFTSFNRIYSHSTVGFVHAQALSGLILYYNSELTSVFLSNIGENIKNAELRFFSLEHSLLMFIAIVLITIGSFKAKRIQGDKNKFKTLMIYLTLGTVIMLFAIPWKMRALFL